MFIWAGNAITSELPMMKSQKRYRTRCTLGQKPLPARIRDAMNVAVIFTTDGDNVKVSVAVKFIDNQTKATQVSQYELTLHKDSNWKIIQ